MLSCAPYTKCRETSADSHDDRPGDALMWSQTVANTSTRTGLSSRIDETISSLSNQLIYKHTSLHSTMNQSARFSVYFFNYNEVFLYKFGSHWRINSFSKLALTTTGVVWGRNSHPQLKLYRSTHWRDYFFTMWKDNRQKNKKLHKYQSGQNNYKLTRQLRM